MAEILIITGTLKLLYFYALSCKLSVFLLCQLYGLVDLLLVLIEACFPALLLTCQAVLS
jgi:hypothetical protein